jgi:hypothetical protein
VISSVVYAATSATINVVGVLLVLLGIVLFVTTIAFWRAAVEDPSVLAPLEVMADRKFARADDERRVDMLNSVRPDGAAPIEYHIAPPVLMREPVSEPEQPFRDPYPHDDDAVDLVPGFIDPLLHQQNKEQR